MGIVGAIAATGVLARPSRDGPLRRCARLEMRLGLEGGSLRQGHELFVLLEVPVNLHILFAHRRVGEVICLQAWRLPAAA